MRDSLLPINALAVLIETRIFFRRGILKIAEVVSRIDDLRKFQEDVCQLGFKLISQVAMHDVPVEFVNFFRSVAFADSYSKLFLSYFIGFIKQNVCFDRL